MGVMLSFLLQFCVLVMIESSLKFWSFLCSSNHVYSESMLLVLGFQLLLRVVLLIHLDF